MIIEEVGISQQQKGLLKVPLLFGSVLSFRTLINCYDYFSLYMVM